MVIMTNLVIIVISNLILMDMVEKNSELIERYIPFFIKSKKKQSLFYLFKPLKNSLFELLGWLGLMIIGSINSFDFLWIFFFQSLIYCSCLFSVFAVQNNKLFNLLLFILSTILEILFIKHLIYFIILTIILIVFIFNKWENNIYSQKKISNLYLFINKYRKSLNILKYIILLICIKINDLWNFFPIEQSVSIVLLYLIANIENLYKHNKKWLSIFRAKNYINLTRKSKPNLMFLSSAQARKFKENILDFIFVCSLILFISNKTLEFLILLLGAFAVVLYTIDTILYGYLFQRSFLYYNTIIREIFSFTVSSLFFSYLMFVTLSKIMVDQNYNFSLFSVQYNIIMLVIFILLNLVLVFRQLKFYK